MKEKFYDLPIENPLTSARRKALNQHIARNVHLSDSPVRYEWEETGGPILRITAEPVTLEVRFYSKKVEIYGAAPLWARLLLTGKKREQLRQEIQLILAETGFVAAQPKETKRMSRTLKPGVSTP